MKFACISKLLSGWRIRPMHTGIYTRLVCTLLCFLVLWRPAIAQSGPGKTITVKGIVRGAKDAPLGGVSIVSKGQDKATVTLADGSFSITVPANTTLLISYVGYAEQEITTTDKDLPDVKLKLGAAKADAAPVKK